MTYRRWSTRLVGPILLALSVSFSTLALANPGQVNSTTNGQNVPGGTYYNTPGAQSTFTNTSKTGLYISPSTVVTGLEVTSGSTPGSLTTTGNGGSLFFDVPGQVVRVDGQINVSALMNGGLYTGNGGTVRVDSAYLYQNGQIYANGIDGGHVQLNVGALTMGPNALIEAKSFGGNGGTINLGNGDGSIDIQKGAIVDASGQVVGNYDTSLITIQGGLINLDGILIANGIQKSDGTATDGNGILLVAYGGSTPLTSDLLSSAPFMSDIQSSLLSRDASLISHLDGWIRVGLDAQILANGADALNGNNGGNGGVIGLLAKCGINNEGLIQANGGKGGSQGTAVGTVSTVIDQPGQNGSVSDSDSGSQTAKGLTQGGSSVTINFNQQPQPNPNNITLPNVQAQVYYLSNGTVAVTFLDTATGQYLTPTTTNPNAHVTTGTENGEPALIFSFGSSASSSAFDGSITFNGTYQGNPIQFTRTVDVLTQVTCGCDDTPKTASTSITMGDPNYTIDEISHTEQASIGGNGGRGGDGGTILLATCCGPINNTGLIEAKGGDGGNGGNAIANSADINSANVGNGGDGGNGGEIKLYSPIVPANFDAPLAPSTLSGLSQSNANWNADPGTPGSGGTATAGNGGTATNGQAGNTFLGDEGGSPGPFFGAILYNQLTSGTDCATCTSDGGDPTPPGNPGDPGNPNNPGNPNTPPTTDNTLDPNFLGLFQEYRPYPHDPTNRDIPPLMIALAQKNMFYARTYTPVTQEILTLALREYNRLIALDRPSGQAEEEAGALLRRSGVDPEIAANLLKTIQEGKLHASDVVIRMLKTISTEPNQQKTSSNAISL